MTSPLETHPTTSDESWSAPLELAVIVGSTRPGRRGRVVADWFVRQTAQRRDIDVDLIDLVDVGLPAALPGEPDPTVDAYVARIDAADAFVVVTPEYNHGYPASLKQAIDVAHAEWYAKPVAFVSYGGMSGGSRAVEQLRQVFAELHTVTTRDTVAFPGIRFDDQGNPHDADAVNAAAKIMLDQLTWWAHALRDAKRTHPYGE